MKIFEKAKNKIKNFKVEDARVNFNDKMSELESNGNMLWITIVAAVVVMFLACLAVFFLTVKGAEQVLVPNVEGKDWSTAEIEMQQKELYPKIQLRYTDDPNDEGKIISQSPSGGAIVKAGSRVTLTISRGVIVDHVGNYIGQNLDDVRNELISMFAGSARPLIVLAEPAYKASNEPLGTILEQEPAEGTEIANPVTVKLIVSRGPAYENTRPPKLINTSIEGMYRVMNTNKIVFDYTSIGTSDASDYGKVVSQQEFEEEYIENYTRMSVTIALPKNGKATIDKVDYKYGIFKANLPDYPFAADMELSAVMSDGSRTSIVTFKHTGGSVTVPYCLEEDCTLILTVAGKEKAKFNVN